MEIPSSRRSAASYSTTTPNIWNPPWCYFREVLVARQKLITERDLLGVYGEVGGVKRAEQDVDTALMDLRGARGENL